MQFAYICGGVLVALLLSGLRSEDAPQGRDPAALDAASRDARESPEAADFAVQGEYEGSTGEGDGQAVKHGVQVVARGNGKFEAVAFRGGLPGAGWDGSKPERTEGARKGEAIELPSLLGGATLRDGSIKFPGRDGAAGGTLGKVERKSPTLGAKPPEGAIVLFDGETSDFEPGTKAADGSLLFGQTSRHVFDRDFRLHLEFRTPFKPRARGQGRGNSGVYLLQRYEIQVLDSFGVDARNDHCGAMYGRQAPRVNVCFPPGAWQTYDVEFQVARFGPDGAVASHPVLTVRHNGVMIHDRLEIAPRREAETPPRSGKLHLQRHDEEPVLYRNIWVTE